MSQTRTFWLSFCDPDRLEGQQFLGVAVVEVSTAEADAASTEVRARFPHAKPGAEWIAAATRKAWVLGCNPGGEIMFADITDAVHGREVPRHRLLSRHEVTALGLL
jgi:hypothetical protein